MVNVIEQPDNQWYIQHPNFNDNPICRMIDFALFDTRADAVKLWNTRAK